MPVSKRNWAAVAVIIAWGAALTWLGLRQLSQSDATVISNQAALRLAPGDAWFRVTSGETQFGYAGITLDTMPDGTYRIREQVNLDLPGPDGLDRVVQSTDLYLGHGLLVDSLSSRRTSPAGTEVYRALADGSAWTVALRPGDSVTTAEGSLTAQAAEGQPVTIVPLRVVPLRLRLVGAIAARDARRLQVADGWPLGVSLTTTEIGADTTIVFADSSEVDPASERWVPVAWDTATGRSVRIDAPGGPLRLVVDTRGDVLEVEYLFGAHWRREDFSVARSSYRVDLPHLRDAVRQALPILRPLTGSRLAADTSRETVAWRISRRDGSPVDTALLAMLASGRQRTGADGLLLVAGQGPGLPRRLGREPSDPFIQDTDTAVAELASHLRGDWVVRLDSLRRVLRRSVRIDTARALPQDAAGALRLGRARPEGAARLAVALLRATGTPARLAIGVLPRGDTLYTHAWVEFTAQGGPVLTFDPLTGGPASTALIRVALAGSTRADELLPRLADVRFMPVDRPGGTGP